MKDCQHKSVTIYYRCIARATYYQPAEYVEFSECDDCGETGDPSDFAEFVEVSDEIEAEKELHGAPSEFYD